jgi:hypothetical protein
LIRRRPDQHGRASRVTVLAIVYHL